jgi:hypothetical protein
MVNITLYDSEKETVNDLGFGVEDDNNSDDEVLVKKIIIVMMK